MSRILVYEWCCATLARGDDPRAASLWAEGRAMLSAVLADCCRVPGEAVRTILSPALRDRPGVIEQLPPIISRRLIVTWSDDEPAAFRAAAADADFALVIAPEFDRILETRCRWAVEAGATLLGPSPEAVALTADKLALANHWQDCGVPTPETVPASGDDPSRKRKRRVSDTVAYASGSDLMTPGRVTKPRFGAGSAGVRLTVPNDRLLSSAPLGELIVQPFIPGRAASAAFLIGARESCSLPPAEQFLSPDGSFRYLGGRAPLSEPLADRAIRIANRAINCVLGLNGYVGVDVILGGPADGSRDFAIEINPRLTTSYIGLRALCEDNLMHWLLRLARGESIANPRWRDRQVTWTPEGNVRICPD